MSGNATKNWRNVVQRVVKTEMSRRDIRYQELSERLAAIGVMQSADNLRNKVNKGILGADLLLQMLSVLNVKQLSFDDIHEMLADVEG
ncbi:DUF6471 domain-containing protein [Alteromonas oceanisediminis]|uniref:DUF6471 domain-containing protein n=1 Tax=Alteromonas oceanisediminis TaxID=2836180 RepID=UPI001BDAEB30|nr:DUF6471 domain-containing protein [Alteromonas oceanisediminis]MBT0585715.1 hypothetical protein [Alteromonas oceanisediminis]